MIRRKVIKKYHLSNAVSLFVIILYPVLFFYLMENFTHNPWGEVRVQAQFFNMLLFELAAGVLVFLTGRARMSLVILGIVSWLFGLGNAYVLRFRSSPIVPWDIFSVKTAASVAGRYDFTPDLRMVIVTACFLLLFIFLFLTEMAVCRTVFWKRLIPAALFTASLLFFTGLLQQESFQNRHRLYNKLFTPVYMTKADGMAVAFVMNLAYMFVDKPDGYSAGEAEELLSVYEQGAAQEETKDLPNIIVMMNESFSDLSVLGELKTNLDYMPFVHELQQGAENTVTGMLHVSVCSGNTPNTEFEFLTGNTMAFLPQGSIPYQQYIKTQIPSLASHLKNLGYETVAMHPFQSYGWERDRVYPLLGFERSLFLRDFQGKEKIRQYISDSACVDKIIEIYEKKKQNTPLFLFNVTMQNHGGYQDNWSNFTPDIIPEGRKSTTLSQYLSLIKLSDAALKELTEYFSKTEEKTVIVFFGDHQPNDSVAAPLLTKDRIQKDVLEDEAFKLRYQVPYVIWANYDIESETDRDISANYLGAEVLKRAGVPLYDYQNFLLELEEKYPVLSAVHIKDKNGRDSDLSEERNALVEYQKLQYYQMFEK